MSLPPYLAIFRWLCIFSTKQWFLDYQEFLLNNQPVPSHVLVLLSILTYMLLHSIYLYLIPLSTHSRMVHFDFTLVWFCAQYYNLGNISLIIATAYLLFCAYYLAPGQPKLRYVIFKLSTILYRGNDGPFLVKRVNTLVQQVNATWCRKAAASQIPICSFIQQLVKWYNRLVIDCASFFISAMLVLNCLQALRFIWMDFESFTFWEVTQLVGNKLALDIEQGASLLLLAIFSYFMFTFTVVAFLQLSQADKYLARAGTTRVGFNRFATHHVTTLVAILQFKPWISYFIFSFTFTQLPSSTHFLARIALGQLDNATIGILLPIVGFDFLIIFGFHLLAAFYTNKIHSCSKPLLALNAQKFIFTKRGAGAVYDGLFHLKVAGYIEKMHTEKPYGIDFGNGEIISLFSFFQFIFFYGQALLFCYKLIESSV